MATLDKKGIIEKISSKVEDTDVQMELLEDIADSFEQKEETISKKDFDKLQTEYDLLKTRYEDVKNKYISRFSEVDSKPVKPVESNEEMTEKKVIDIRSIF